MLAFRVAGQGGRERGNSREMRRIGVCAWGAMARQLGGGGGRSRQRLQVYRLDKTIFPQGNTAAFCLEKRLKNNPPEKIGQTDRWMGRWRDGEIAGGRDGDWEGRLK